MAELTFNLASDETAVLELKLGQYLVGETGPIGPTGPPGAEGTLTPDDMATIDAATAAAQASANAAAGSATSASQSASTATNQAGQAATAQQGAAASATAASQSASNASGSATAASTSASAASASQTAAANSATAASTSQSNAAQWEALAQAWATQLGSTVDGTSYSAKYYAQQAGTSAGNAASSATAAGNSATNAAASATAAANSAGNASATLAASLLKTNNLSDVASPAQACTNIGALQAANNLSDITNAAQACANIGAVKKSGDTMTGALIMRANVAFQKAADGSSLGYISSDPNYGIGTINAAGSAWNFYVNDAGNMTVRTSATIGGSLAVTGSGTFGASISCTGVTVASGAYHPALAINISPNYMGFLNSASTAWLFTVQDASGNGSLLGSLTCAGGITSTYRLTLNRMGNNAGETALQAGDGTAMAYQRCRNGSLGGYEFVNNAYSAVAWYTDDSGNITCRALSQTSDYRMKQAVQTIAPADALARLMQARPVDFEWKDSGQASRGFLAHELQACEPMAVIGEQDAMQPSPDGKTEVMAAQAVNHTPIIADLVAALQGLAQQVAELKARLA